MQQVEVTDRHQAEGLARFRLRPGDIAVMDAGYPVGTTVEQAKSQQIDVVVRATNSHLRLETEAGKRIDLKKRIRTVPHGCAIHLQGWVNLPESKQREQVRLIVFHLPQEQAQRARDRKRARLRKKHGKKYNEELVWWAGWILVVTTLKEQDWSDEEVLQLYRARWQIELVFKRIKQGFNFHGLAIQDWKRANVAVQLRLVLWSIQEQEQHWVREQLQLVAQATLDCQRQDCFGDTDTEDDSIVSSWMLSQFCLEQLRITLRGSWSRHRLQSCLPLLQRYLLSHQRKKRTHQETSSRIWLTQKLAHLMPLFAA